MTKGICKRMTALALLLAMLVLIMPAGTVRAEQDESGISTVADGEIVSTTVGDTQYIYIAEGRQMLIYSFNDVPVDGTTTIDTSNTNTTTAAIQMYTKTADTGDTRYVLITGGTANMETQFTLNNGGASKTYTVRVFPASTQNNTATRDVDGNLFVNYFKISVEGQLPTDGGLFFALNGGELYSFDNAGSVIDQGIVGQFVFMYFCAPGTKNALIGMGATGTAGNFYILDSDTAQKGGSAWSGVGSTALSNGSITEDALKNLFDAALEEKCNSAAVINRAKSTYKFDSTFSFSTQELPVVTTALMYQKKDTTGTAGTEGTEGVDDSDTWYEYSDGVELTVGDKLKYIFTINNLDSTQVTFSDIVLTCDPLSDFGFTITTAEVDAASKDTKTVQKEFIYTISEDDLKYYTGGKLTLNISLSCSYTSTFSKNGSFTDNKQVAISCAIHGLVSYDWGDLPAELRQGLTLPDSIKIDNLANYIIGSLTDSKLEVKETDEYGTYTVQTWQFAGWIYTDESGKTHEIAAGAAFPTEYNETSLSLKAKWTVVDIKKCSVTFCWIYGDQSGTNMIMECYPGQIFSLESVYYQGFVQVTKNGSFSFLGWYADKEGTDPLGEQMTMDSENVTVYGIWKQAGTITFQVSDDFSQPCLFHIEGPNLSVTYYVVAGRPVVLDGLVVGGTYTVTVLSSWAWRYDYNEPTMTITVDEKDQVCTLSHKLKNTQWLDLDIYDSFLFKPNEEVEHE